MKKSNPFNFALAILALVGAMLACGGSQLAEANKRVPEMTNDK